MLLRGAAAFGVTLTSGTLLTLAVGLASCFTAGIVVVLVVTTNVVELDTFVSLLCPWLLAEAANGVPFRLRPDEQDDLAKVFSGKVLEGNCVVTVAACCWLTVTVLVTGAVVFEACAITSPVDAVAAGLVEELDELTTTLLVVMADFDEYNDVAVKGELFVAVVTTLLPNMVLLPKLVPELKSLELLTIVAKLGKDLCSRAILVGTL